MVLKADSAFFEGCIAVATGPFAFVLAVEPVLTAFFKFQHFFVIQPMLYMAIVVDDLHLVPLHVGVRFFGLSRSVHTIVGGHHFVWFSF